MDITKFIAQLEKEVQQGTKSNRTLDEYVKIAQKLQHGQLTAANIRSQSRFLQVKAVVKLLQLTGCVAKDDTCGLNMDLLASEFKRGKSENTQVAHITEKVLTEEQFDALLTALPTTSRGEELRFACIIARNSGARISEILALQPTDFALTADSIVVSIQCGKGRKPRTIYLPLSLASAVQRFQGFAIDRMYVAATINRIMGDLGINSSFHGLRHTFATEATAAGVDVVTLANVLGHSDVKTTMRYAHVKKETPSALLKLWQNTGKLSV